MRSSIAETSDRISFGCFGNSHFNVRHVLDILHDSGIHFCLRCSLLYFKNICKKSLAFLQVKSG